ncbi:MAG: purine-nucleoside phosphorylase [Candidatus Cloacimonas sp.]|nr:purine-nucleoside phosphorylase [Candidatus Cloacimonadota bacterium]
MVDYRNAVIEAAKYVKEKSAGFKPKIGIILGTGLSSFTDNLNDTITINYKEIPNFPVSTAPSHKGNLILGQYGSQNVIAMQGRFHYYEGYSMDKVTFPIRVMKELGVELIIVTNAAGGLNPKLKAGSIVLIKDHINHMGTNPLIGPNDEYFGERFPSMNDPYSKRLRDKFLQISEEKGIEVTEGVYIGVTGPSIETVSECRAFLSWGADVVGMSTVPEVIVSVHSGIEVLGISIVTNMSNLYHNEEHSQQEIQDTAQRSYDNINRILEVFVEKAFF